jgi:hypothetical protein
LQGPGALPLNGAAPFALELGWFRKKANGQFFISAKVVIRVSKDILDPGFRRGDAPVEFIWPHHSFLKRPQFGVFSVRGVHLKHRIHGLTEAAGICFAADDLSP